MTSAPPVLADLALVVIVRNEAAGIARCLLSARDHVRRMVVLDTGSTDDTVAIARACGALVHQAAWRDDFAWARNHALDLADADWNLMLDGDEWIESGAESLVVFMQAADAALGVVLQKSGFEVAGQAGEGNAWVTRLLPRGARFEGRVHEQVVSGLPRHRTGLVLGHDGYMPERMQAKAGRNRTLLQQELAERPDNPYVLYQLGKDHDVFGETGPAGEFYLQALPLCLDGAPYKHDLVIRLLHCLGQAGRLDDAIVLAGEVMPRWQDSPDYFFTAGNLFLDAAIAQPGQAVDTWLPMAEQAWLRCLEIGERPELEGSVAGRGSYLAAHNLAVLFEGRGRKQEASRYAQLASAMRAGAR